MACTVRLTDSSFNLIFKDDFIWTWFRTGSVLLPDRVPGRVHDSGIVAWRNQSAVRAHHHPAGIHPRLGHLSSTHRKEGHPHGQVSMINSFPSSSRIAIITRIFWRFFFVWRFWWQYGRDQLHSLFRTASAFTQRRSNSHRGPGQVLHDRRSGRGHLSHRGEHYCRQIQGDYALQ